MRSWLYDERVKRGLSQANLSRITDITQAQISAWEHNKAIPDDSHLKLVLDAFNKVDSGDLPSEMRLRNHKPAQVRARKQATPKRVSTGLSEAEKCVQADLLSRWSEESSNKPTAIALFAGCGGFSQGFRAAGFDLAGFVEINHAARATYRLNSPNSAPLGADISLISTQEAVEWRETFGNVDVLIGGPPCQGFSLAGKRDENDPRNQLFREYARITSAVRPSVIVLENVRLLTSMKAPDERLVTDHVIDAFDELGYQAEFSVLNAQNFGVPQFRERVFFVATDKSKPSLRPSFPSETHKEVQAQDLFGGTIDKVKTFRDAAADLEPLESGERSRTDPFHWAVKHPDRVIKWLKGVPQGGSAHDNEDPNLRPPSGYNTTYKRLKWDEPCSTIGTTFGMISACRNVHPRDTRSLTIREALRCQSFPDDFQFNGTVSQIRTMIGNAVPPDLAHAIALHVKSKILRLDTSVTRSQEHLAC